MGHVLLRTIHFVVIEESPKLIRLTRTGENIGSGPEAVACWMKVSAVLDRAGRKGRSLLCDLRLSPPRNDPEFEQTMGQVVPITTWSLGGFPVTVERASRPLIQRCSGGRDARPTEN